MVYMFMKVFIYFVLDLIRVVLEYFVILFGKMGKEMGSINGRCKELIN